MSDEARKNLMLALEEALAKVKEDPNYGLELLVRAGILDENHAITEPYKHLCIEEDQG